MKRTQKINLARMRHGRKNVTPHKIALAVATAISLSGCGEDMANVAVYRSVQECINSGLATYQVCQTRYEQALRSHVQSSPKYLHKSDCQIEFFDCEINKDKTWSPLLAGFAVSRTTQRNDRCTYGQPSDGYCHSSVGTYFYTGGYRSSGWYDGAGRYYGRLSGYTSAQKIPTKALAQPAKAVRTLSRSGFGSSVIAKSSWRSSSSSRSWGG